MLLILLGVILQILYIVLGIRFSGDLSLIILVSIFIFIPSMISLLHGIKQFFFSEIIDGINKFHAEESRHKSSGETKK